MNDRLWPVSARFGDGISAGLPLNFCLLGYFERVIYFDSKVTHRAHKLGMAKQQLNGPKILRAAVD